ncbi:MAG: RES family NAD+ phosphorylase [Siphonobacter aquaeclarae]|nr:RES family NAD+ phosphorylase [Siphonobacter aquaeclarae]
MLTVYRTIKDKHKGDPLSTEGARIAGGRWNPKNFPVLYTTSSPALALVESLVHAPRVRYEKLPAMWLFTLEIPDSVRYLPADELPAYWQDPGYERSQWILEDWLRKPDILAVAVPSVVVTMSYNYLLHPLHPLFQEVKIVRQEPFPVERRLWNDPA